MSKSQGHKDFWKPSKSCHVGIHWKALAEDFQMSTHLPWFQSFSVFLYHFVLAKLATTSIRVNSVCVRFSSHLSLPYVCLCLPYSECASSAITWFLPWRHPRKLPVIFYLFHAQSYPPKPLFLGVSWRYLDCWVLIPFIPLSLCPSLAIVCFFYGPHM